MDKTREVLEERLARLRREYEEILQKIEDALNGTYDGESLAYMNEERYRLSCTIWEFQEVIDEADERNGTN